MALINICDPGAASTAQVFNSNGNTTAIPVCGANIASGWETLACQVVATVSTPANKTWTVVSGNNITITAHGFTTGLACTLTTGGALPTGLATSTTYYIIKVDANTIAFASSLVNATAGTKITLSDAGSGTSTVVVTALASASVKLQKSIDGTNWYDEGSAQTVTATGNFAFNKVDPEWKYYSILVTLASGQLSVTAQYLGKGNVG